MYEKHFNLKGKIPQVDCLRAYPAQGFTNLTCGLAEQNNLIVHLSFIQSYSFIVFRLACGSP